MIALITIIITSLIFGYISQYINQSKGYEGGFWWGFLLWAIGIIVVAVKPQNVPTISHAPASTVVNVLGTSTTPEEQLTSLKLQGVISEEEYNQKIAELQSKAAAAKLQSSDPVAMLGVLHDQNLLSDEEYQQKVDAIREKESAEKQKQEEERQKHLEEQKRIAAEKLEQAKLLAADQATHVTPVVQSIDYSNAVKINRAFGGVNCPRCGTNQYSSNQRCKNCGVWFID